ncbi:MAG: gliding motility-associated C-terminal domain-containing protein, partial [Bacteroidales bacterium]|nr:gliding motility-associated C-terminal domain-containing protein [Bacteroidales bacterium]
VTDSIGCQGDDSLWLKVNPLPQFSVNPAQSVICIGDSVNINAGSTVGNYSYSWSTGPTTSSIVVNPNASSTYTVTATDTLGCFDSLQSIVTVNPLPQLEILPLDAKLCLGDTMILSVNSNPAAQSVSWSGGGTGIQKQVWPTVNTIYTVSVTDVNNCHNTTSREVKVFNKPIITILPEIDSICNGDSIQHQVFSTNPIFSILWNTMDTTDIITTIPPITRVYSAFVIDTNGCWGTDSAEVVVKHRPQVNILPEQLWSCTADSLMIACLTTAAPGSLHVWDFDGGNILSGSGTNPHWLKWTNPGSYIVTLFAEQNGCFSKTDTAIIDVFETPVVDFIADPTAACENVNVQFQNLTANIQHYHWNFGNPLVQDDTSNLENPTYAYPQPGTYGIRLQVVSNDGCKAEDFKPAYVIVSPNPVADFEGFPKEVSILDPKISFWDFSIDALTWEYDFDDPNSGSSNFANIKYPWHNFTDTGYYDVQLVVTNEYGCTDTAYRTFYVKPFPQLYFPDAFTPNGDGLNDVFQVVGHDFDWNTFEMNILDRWGRVLFRTTDVNEGWNGKEFNTGNMCPPANYVVVIKVSDRDKNPEVFRGRVVLVR